MSSALGPLSYSEDDGEVFLGRSVTQHKNVSDETAHTIDKEIRTIINTNYKRAEEILKEHEKALHMMSDALMKYETIDAEQIAQIMQGKEPGPPKDWDDSGGDGRATPAEPKAKSSKPTVAQKPAGQH